jgi:YVTN family beta-propeller protein
MSEVLSGVVTFLFTDIEGSTRLVKHFRERWGEIVGEHQRLLRASFRKHGGRELDTQGDSFFVVFPSARGAVLAAVDGQRAVLAHPWPEGAALRVRMGIHTGQAVVGEGRYTGLAVHRAARIGAAAHGGQVLVSQATQTLIEDEEEDLAVVLRDLGEQPLKDLDRPVRLYQVAADGLPDRFPPLRREPPLPQAAEAALAAPRLWRGRLIMPAAVLAVVALAAVLAIVLTRGGDAVTVRPNSVGVIDPKNSRVIDQLSVGVRPGPMTAGGGAIWVANIDDRTLTRIDPRSRSVVHNIPLQRTPTDVAYGEHAVWVANGLLGTIERVDPQFDTLDNPIETETGRASTGSVAVGFGSVWFVSGNSNGVRLDPDSGRKTATFFSGASPAGIAVDGEAAWVANAGGNDVWRFSPATSQKVYMISTALPTGITSGGGAVWVASSGFNVVTRINPLTEATVPIPVGRHPSAIAYGAGSLWVANGNDGTVWRIDPRTNTVTKKIKVGNDPEGIVVARNLVWVAVQAG